jgi:hypothetical protein
VKKFSFAAIAMIITVLSFGIISQNVDDRTMTGCKVSFMSNPFANTAPANAITSCGYVYVGAHMGKDFLNPGKIADMNAALLSGKTVTIKATGIGFLVAYDIIVEE